MIDVEYQHLFQGDATDKLELKGIVAHDFGPWTTAVNFAIEVERLSDAGKLNPEFEYALGVSREIGSPAFKIGVEAFGKLEKPDTQLEKFIWVGPAVSWATGPHSALSGIWFTLAAGKGLTEDSRAACGTATNTPDKPTSQDEASGDLYRAKCAACHRLHPPAERTRAEWAKAIDRYGPRAHLTAVESSEILRWLQGRASDANAATDDAIAATNAATNAAAAGQTP